PRPFGNHRITDGAQGVVDGGREHAAVQIAEWGEELVAHLHLEADAAGPVLGDADAEEAGEPALLLVGPLQAGGDPLVVVVELRRGGRHRRPTLRCALVMTQAYDEFGLFEENAR